MSQFIDINTNNALIISTDESMCEDGSNVIAVWYAQHRHKLLVQLQSVVRDRAIAEELLHEGFLKVSRMPAMCSIRSPYAFLSKIFNNLAVDYLRQQSRKPVHESEDILLTIESQDESYIEAIDRSRKISHLHEMINELPSRSREVLLLVKLRELTLKEAALELGISQTMVEKHLQRAYVKCRAALAAKADNR